MIGLSLRLYATSKNRRTWGQFTLPKVPAPRAPLKSSILKGAFTAHLGNQDCRTTDNLVILRVLRLLNAHHFRGYEKLPEHCVHSRQRSGDQGPANGGHR